MRSSHLLPALLISVVCATIAISGCKPPEPAQSQAPKPNTGIFNKTTQEVEPPEPAQSQAPKPNTGIFNKKTQEVGELDPNGNRTVQDYDPGTHNPINPLSALKQYKSMISKISKLGIKKAVDLFHAEHGRYPKDHEEFMSKIIKRNKIQLPVLAGKAEYQYDVENHELVIVESQDKEK